MVLTWPEELGLGVEIDLDFAFLGRYIIKFDHVTAELFLPRQRFRLIMLAGEYSKVEAQFEFLQDT